MIRSTLFSSSIPAVSIFKAYDIRGVVPDQLDPEIAERVGRATASFLPGGEIAVGRDARLTAPL